MLFTIHHNTTYSYSQPVALGPHILRLRPRIDGSQRLLDFQLRIEPEPSLLSECLDLEGNSVVHAWFSGMTTRLHIASAITLETLRRDPFDYRLEAGFNRLPATYDATVEPRLAPYYSAAGITPGVHAFAQALAAEAGSDPVTFLGTLNDRLHAMIDREIRPEGEAQSPELTLTLKKGACRDLTVLFMVACRVHGLATRFVSGYQKGRPERRERYLHAWPEVYLPGGGWRGYDPTHGSLVADEHVPLAAAHHQSGTMPIEGAFTAPAGVTSQLEFTVTINTR